MNKRTHNMYKIFILFALLPHLFCAETPGRTSCSKYFKHTIDPETGKIFGRIEIRHFLLENEIYLKVALNATTLNGLFRLELARSIKETIRAIERGRPLLYHINFPSDANFLILSAIWFNKRQYCLGPRGSNGNIVANIELGHIVYPPNKPLPQDFQPWHRNSSGYRINNPNYKTHAECGVTNYYTEGTNSLIPNGAMALPGQWPWVVALFRTVQTDLVTQRYFNCGGSLLTNKHVITGMLIEKIKYFRSPYIELTICASFQSYIYFLERL
ncbi:PREDICTED: uncharacterized protein LOC105556175 [Vollenhovia emeryi]|uniref:uncharacterized protein LOC105556175 n=1 Tax=Vollenhovia emeryi TaxID=411798 RepID=UPI0005F441DC|nr:PREDICTED: uncharacterized protein LOC105556175 [Vollenhovia emeryi]